MFETIWNFTNNTFILKVLAWAGLPLTFLLILLFCLKSNRDERGWKILGKASIITFVFFIILVNLFARLTGKLVAYNYEIGYVYYGFTIQFIYDIVLILEISSILILRKIE